MRPFARLEYKKGQQMLPSDASLLTLLPVNQSKHPPHTPHISAMNTTSTAILIVRDAPAICFQCGFRRIDGLGCVVLEC